LKNKKGGGRLIYWAHPHQQSLSVVRLLAGILLSLAIPATSFADSDVKTDACEPWSARVVSLQGAVETRLNDERRWQPVEQGETFCGGNIIHTQSNSRVALELSNETIIRLDQNSSIVLPKQIKASSWINLLEGGLNFLTRVPNTLSVQTPYLNASVEGTEFAVTVTPNETQVGVTEGRVRVTNSQGQLLLTDGQSASARDGEAPVRRIDLIPEDAVQWSLYYPSIIDKGHNHTLTPPLIMEADQLLAVGRVIKARALLDTLLLQSPDNVRVHAMLSIIALTQNHNSEALTLAQSAFTLDPTSPEAAIALSYVQQAQFDLRAAHDTLHTALRITPDNSLLLARQAELLLSLGNLEQAERLAQQAIGLDENQAHALTILGFSHLGQFEVERARHYFERAIQLNQADPLPRLGHGLAVIRDGNLSDGRREIEVAATLNPNNALIRSYLGKAYYEEKRTALAADQFILAKALDPLDPTPWFYDAIRKQTLNRPVEALQDLQQSIRLNDNRAVYRSRLLLDQDHAARGTSLARIYNDLGFQQLALSEGWKSVNTAPSNHSAHRLLADSYSALPRHEIARVSELLQAQLLQPLNLNPIQPQLAESSLGILDGAGPTNASANEFNPLFTRNRFSLQVRGVTATQDSDLEPNQDHNTRSVDLVHSGVWGRYSYSVGTFHDYNEGIRPNHDQDREIDNAFIQMALDHNTSIQFEYRNTQTEEGDLPLRYDPALFFDERELMDSRILRLGLRHDVKPGSTLLFSAISNNTEGEKSRTTSPPFDSVTSDFSESGHTFELQHHFNARNFTTISGAGTYRSDQKVNIYISAAFLPAPAHFALMSENRHHNGYLYTNIEHGKSLTSTLGVSVDDPTTQSNQTTQINPKLGLIWQPDDSITIRTAAFRTMARSMVANQTLEPTQVAGFNQFFDDINNADVRRYGIALEKNLDSLNLGIETSKRDLEVPFLAAHTNTIFKADWKEHIGRAYAYWTPLKWMAAKAEYQHETFKRPLRESVDDRDDTTGIPDLTTHQIPLGISLFSTQGTTTHLTATRIKQTGTFATDFTPTSTTTKHSSDQFWVIDAAISYQLNKRLGHITIGAKNLFDKKFNFHNTDIATTGIQPERMVFARLSLTL